MYAYALPKPYLLFVGDIEVPTLVKTGMGVRDWAREDCVGQWRLSDRAHDLGLKELTPAAAVANGAKSLLISVAPVGGHLPQAWIAHMVSALEAGLDIVSGLHDRLSMIEPIARAAERYGRSLFDIRHSDHIPIPIANGRKRAGKRLLMVGTDCALGKKYTALALAKAMQASGITADFRATGQTGIMISGAGIAIDAVVADFIAGAAEVLSPDAVPDHWDVIEGQGSLFHPAYAGVTLGLLHGSQPDALILCHQPGRTHVAHFKGYELPSLSEAIEAYLPLARRTNPRAVFAGISLNTSLFEMAEAQELMAAIENDLGLPVFDPLRSDLGPVIERILTCV
jgi:uncharacterized NAD-dependent epimerase/dehydratase family protein